MYLREIDDPVTIQYIILFTLAKADRRVTHSQLSCLTLDSCNINFTNFQIALDNLTGIEYVKVLPNGFDENMPIYELTEKGRQAAGFFSHNIPVYIREQIEEHITPFFLEESQKKNVKAKLAPINEKEYNVECAIYENASPLLELTFYAGDRETAARMVRNFKKNTEIIYSDILATLLGNEE